jgi:predicted CoA-binding protein
MKTLIIGASDKPDRYANKAMHMLEHHGHEVLLVHPALKVIEGHKVFPGPDAVTEPVHTITMYVNPSISDGMEAALKRIHPERVIFNPGSENPRLARILRADGIAVEEACTLVLLQTNQF